MGKLQLNERESLLDRLIIWILGTPGKELERLNGLMKSDLSKADQKDIIARVKQSDVLKKKYPHLYKGK